MATRPISAGSRGPKVDWRTALRRSVRRSAEIAGALVLLAGMVFLALAMATYVVGIAAIVAAIRPYAAQVAMSPEGSVPGRLRSD